ncbi:MAG: ATP synthase F1 subunit gamma [Candidatus Electryonea clarkiae]|nr:ATP synthase F1 subunit gamma [Candidatus Electryonea clarkiae]MDP8286310.1 ATP synthase F1 subunit gamma [Candidatus Electryonea clarkiae]
MPSLKQIKRRISSITNTKQITRAMKMVAAAYLKRAQDNMMKARPYSDHLKIVIRDLAARTDEDAHPLLQVREPKDVGIIVVTSDRGLAGGFNNNICRAAEKIINKEQEKARQVQLITVGRRGYDYFRRRGASFIQHHIGLMKDFDFGAAQSIGNSVTSLYDIGFTEDLGLDRVYIVYNEFKNVVQQNIITEQLFPIIPELADSDEKYRTDFIYEPDEKAVLDHVLPLYVNITIWRILLESFAAEHAARMTAMDNATKNAGDLIDRLTLQYNKARQASITKEILEVVSGAEALK